MIDHLDPHIQSIFPVIIFTLGLLKAIQRESSGYERFPGFPEEILCVTDELINARDIKNDISNSPGVFICSISNYCKMYSAAFYYRASSQALCGALTLWLMVNSSDTVKDDVLRGGFLFVARRPPSWNLACCGSVSDGSENVEH